MVKIVYSSHSLYPDVLLFIVAAVVLVDLNWGIFCVHVHPGQIQVQYQTCHCHLQKIRRLASVDVATYYTKTICKKIPSISIELKKSLNESVGFNRHRDKE